MTNWKYRLEIEGKVLRKLIDEEKEAEIIEQIQKCYQTLLKKLNSTDREDYESDIEEALGLLNGEADMIRNNPDEITSEDGWGFDSITDLVDERLEAFYDICDSLKCWIGL